MTNEYENYQEELETLNKNKDFYLDEKDFFAKFIFTPEIQDKADYRHIDKNLAITRLSSRYKEPEMARAILRALHVLSNVKYFYEATEQEFIGYRTEEIIDRKTKNVYVKKTPIYKEVKVLKSYYPKTYHTLKAKFYSLTTTSMARDGHLLRGASTRRLEKTESIEDRTKNKTGFWGFNSKKNDEGY